VVSVSWQRGVSCRRDCLFVDVVDAVLICLAACVSSGYGSNFTK